MHEQNKEIALESVTISVGWWPTHKQAFTDFVHALPWDDEHQEDLASFPTPGVKLD